MASSPRTLSRRSWIGLTLTGLAAACGWKTVQASPAIFIGPEYFAPLVVRDPKAGLSIRFVRAYDAIDSQCVNRFDVFAAIPEQPYYLNHSHTSLERSVDL